MTIATCERLMEECLVVTEDHGVPAVWRDSYRRRLASLERLLSRLEANLEASRAR